MLQRMLERCNMRCNMPTPCSAPRFQVFQDREKSERNQIFRDPGKIEIGGAEQGVGMLQRMLERCNMRCNMPTPCSASRFPGFSSIAKNLISDFSRS